jgi:stage III sporulation protein AH
MPTEILDLSNVKETVKEEDDNVVLEVEESDALEALRLTSDEERIKEMEDLRLVLTNVNSTIDEKNNAYEKLKLIEETKGKEEKLESKIKEEYNLASFIKIDNNQIKVIVAEDEHNYSLANNIIRTIQDEFSEKMYITVKFQV